MGEEKKTYKFNYLNLLYIPVIFLLLFTFSCQWTKTVRDGKTFHQLVNITQIIAFVCLFLLYNNI